MGRAQGLMNIIYREFPDWEFALRDFTDLRLFYRIESLLPTVIQPQAIPATVREAR